MAIKKSRILAIIAVFMLAIMCLGLSACDETKTGPLTCSGSVNVAVDAKIEDVLNGVTVTFDSADDENDFSVTGYKAIREKGVIIYWSGSSQKLKDNGTKCRIVFNYLGNSCSIEYYVGGGASSGGSGGSGGGATGGNQQNQLA